MNQALPMTTGMQRAEAPAGRTGWRGLALTGLALAALVSAGCSTTRLSGPAPVEDRGFSRPEAVAAKPGAENAGKPGHYTVRCCECFRPAPRPLHRWRLQRRSAAVAWWGVP